MTGALSDKLHQRAKQRFARKPATKSQRDRILIVCEGERDEPRYFESLCKDKRLSVSTDVRICGEECDSAPSSVYEYAIDELKRNFRDTTSDDYDRVYCVFDKDTHACYTRTLEAIRKKPKHEANDKAASIIAINSVPCFEFWILLHFELTASPFENSAEVGKRIKKEWAAYSKTKPQDLYAHLKNRTDDAIRHAKTVLKTAQGDNPSTRIHILVSDLIEQSKK